MFNHSLGIYLEDYKPSDNKIYKAKYLRGKIENELHQIISICISSKKELPVYYFSFVGKLKKINNLIFCLVR